MKVIYVVVFSLLLIHQSLSSKYFHNFCDTCDTVARAGLALTDALRTSFLVPGHVFYPVVQHFTSLNFRDTGRVTEVVCNIVDKGFYFVNKCANFHYVQLIIRYLYEV